MCQMKIQYIPFCFSSMLNSMDFLESYYYNQFNAYLKYSIFASLKQAKDRTQLSD